MKLVSMKKAKVQDAQPDMATSTGGDYKEPEYPWGLELRLDEESIKKLGIDLPKAAQEMLLTAKVYVSNVGSQESEQGLNRNLCLQITEMALDTTKDKNRIAQEMYKGK